MGFLLGFIIGLIVSPLLLALFSKAIMRWFVKRQALRFVDNVSNKLSGLQDEFQNLEYNDTGE